MLSLCENIKLHKDIVKACPIKMPDPKASSEIFLNGMTI